MAKTNVSFNNNNYSIDEASLSTASAALASHLSTVMNGSGATINLGGVSYGVDSTKLSAATSSFVSHLGTIAGGSGGSDTLTWDGNTDRLVCVGGAFYKISDATPTENDFANGFSVVVGGEVVEFSKEMVSEMVAMIGADVLSFGGGFVAYTDGASANDGGFIFPEAGIYFYYGDDSKMTSLTIPNYTGFGGGSGSKVTVNGVEYSIDPAKLSGAVAELETVLGGLNSPDAPTLGFPIEWNTMDIMDNPSIMSDGMRFIKVSDFTPTEDELAASKMRVSANGQEEIYSCSGTQSVEGLVMAAYAGDLFVFSVITAGEYPDAGISFVDAGFYVPDLGSMGTDADITIDIITPPSDVGGFPIAWNSAEVVGNVSFESDGTSFVKVSDFTPSVSELMGTEMKCSVIEEPFPCEYAHDVNGIVMAQYADIKVFSVTTAGDCPDLGINFPETGFYAYDIGSDADMDAEFVIDLVAS